jgi:sortase A
MSLRALHRFLRYLQYALLTGAIAMLGYCAFVVADARIFQAAERRQLDRILSQSRMEAGSTRQSAAFGMPGNGLPAASQGMLGRIEISRLGVSVMVIEGTTPTALRRAAGHIEGTALPGQPGNIGISAHRDTFFRPLRNIRGGDLITLTTLGGVYRYRVTTTRIVDPQDIDVLAAGKKESLTLVTCYPFYLIGAAPKRFIVHADRVA